MLRRVLCLCLVGGLVAAVAPIGAQQSATDPEVVKGVKQVEDGEYDAAILTLDNAARRLAADATKSKDLSQAYLYLGVAYVGKGHEAAAKAKFREAVKQLKDLSLSPEKFPPRVIDLFEAAREEQSKSAGATPAPGARKAESGGGSKKGLLIGGAAVAAGGGAYLAFGRKNDGGCNTVYFERDGLLNNSQLLFEPSVGPAGEAGHWKADLNWTVTGASPGVGAFSSGSPLPTDLKLRVFELSPSGRQVADGLLVSSTNRQAEWEGLASTPYILKISIEGGGSASFRITVDGPCQ